MRVKEVLVLFGLAALWGASFLFIKVAIVDMSPLTLVFIRLVLGALGLLAGESNMLRQAWPLF
jgi:drug/metabolite transporter (DMT)-like permease